MSGRRGGFLVGWEVDGVPTEGEMGEGGLLPEW